MGVSCGGGCTVSKYRRKWEGAAEHVVRGITRQMDGLQYYTVSTMSRMPLSLVIQQRLQGWVLYVLYSAVSRVCTKTREHLVDMSGLESKVSGEQAHDSVSVRTLHGD